MTEKRGFKKELKSYFIITIGVVLMAAGIYFFKFPNNFSTGGVSSMSIILTSVFPKFTAAQYMIVINIVLLCIGLAVFGKKFAIKTVYSSIMLSFVTCGLEIWLPLIKPLTDQKFLELLFATGFIAAGSALMFNEDASSGGTDIVAMILKRFTSFDIGKALFCTDIALALAAFIIFDIETGLFSVFGLMLKAFVVDNLIESINLSKSFTIVTDRHEEICKFIIKNLHRGATLSKCCGAFTDNEKLKIVTVLNRGQAVLLKKYIKEIDPHAFTIITNSSDILGKGFRNV